MKTNIINAVNSIIKSEISILERTAKNCEFYKREGMTEHFINEVGCLRGIMYALDEIGIPYPCFSAYYNEFIKPAADLMEQKEPFTQGK